MFFLNNEIGHFLILMWDMIIDNCCLIFKVLLLPNIVTKISYIYIFKMLLRCITKRSHTTMRHEIHREHKKRWHTRRRWWSSLRMHNKKVMYNKEVTKLTRSTQQKGDAYQGGDATHQECISKRWHITTKLTKSTQQKGNT